MNYLILGASGQDGTIAAKQLVERGEVVFAGVREQPRADHPIRLAIPSERVISVDVRDRGAIQAAFERSRPDRVLNLAGFSHVGRSWENPAGVMSTNAIGALNVLDVVRELGLTDRVRVYQASSSEMFGQPVTEPQNENTPLEPVTPYGASKAAAHQLATMYREHFGVWISLGILYNHESRYRSEDYVVRHVTASVARIAAGSQQQLRIGNMDAVRDWGFAPDYVLGMLAMLEHSQPDDFVLATGQAHSVRRLVETAFQAAGIGDWGNCVQVDARRVRPLDPHNLVGDATRARQLLQWAPSITFEEMIHQFVQHELEREPH